MYNKSANIMLFLAWIGLVICCMIAIYYG